MLVPKKVKCIQTNGSFDGGKIYSVDGKGFIVFESGNKSGIAYNCSYFRPIYTDEELLKYAAKMYPIGTKYKTASKVNNDIAEACRKPIISNGSIDVGPGFAYYKETNTWAEIISQPEVSVKTPLENSMSFAIKCPIDYSTNELWKNYINWFNSESGLSVGGNGSHSYYGIDKKGQFDYSESIEDFKVIKPFSYISEILNLEQSLKIGDWINIINEPIDGSRPPNWHPDMNKYFGTWQQVVSLVAGKPCVDGSWCIEHSNYTDIKTNEEYIRDVVSKSESTLLVLPKTFAVKSKLSFETIDTSDKDIISTTSKLIGHNAQYDKLMLERQRIFEEDQKITESLLFSNPLAPSECYLTTPDGWTPAGTFTKAAANLIATKPVKVTGYKYVNLKNK